MKKPNLFLTIFALVCTLLVPLPVAAGDKSPDHSMVIQVNTRDQLSQKMALVNAGNLKSQLGPENVAVEVVVYGPGVSMIKEGSVFTKRIGRLQNQGVRFSVCAGTLKSMAERHGEEPRLIENIGRVRTGALRILELQEQGYAYMRP